MPKSNPMTFASFKTFTFFCQIIQHTPVSLGAHTSSESGTKILDLALPTSLELSKTSPPQQACFKIFLTSARTNDGRLWRMWPFVAFCTNCIENLAQKKDIFEQCIRCVCFFHLTGQIVKRPSPPQSSQHEKTISKQNSQTVFIRIVSWHKNMRNPSWMDCKADRWLPAWHMLILWGDAHDFRSPPFVTFIVPPNMSWSL